MIPRRQVFSHCNHPFCLTQDQCNPWPLSQDCIQKQSYNCKHPIKNQGIYDCHSDDLERFEEILNNSFHPLIIWSRELPLPTMKMLEKSSLQLFIDGEDDINVVTPILQDFKNSLFVLINPLKNPPREVLRLREVLKNKHFTLEEKSTYSGLYYDKRLSDYEERVPDVEIVKETNVTSPLVSIIIPHFNHQREIENTLKELFRNEEAMEVIIVDDGSSPRLEITDYDVTLLRLEREDCRKMGDSTYRAGIARNIGFNHSKGKHIVFLDADMLVPHNFIDIVLTELLEADFIQFKRLHLKEEVVLQPYENLLPNSENFYSRSGGYFEQFQEDSTDWSETPHGWKYFSTFCIGMKRDSFMEHGPFSPSFCLYGFEDVELGWRAWSKGETFKKVEAAVLAQFHEKDRSEYQNNQNNKKEILKKTGELFFTQNPSLEAFEAIKGILE